MPSDSGLQNELKNHREDIKDLDEKVNNLTTKQAVLQRDVENNTFDIKTHTVDIGGQGKRLTSVENRIKTTSLIFGGIGCVIIWIFDHIPEIIAIISGRHS